MRRIVAEAGPAVRVLMLSAFATASTSTSRCGGRSGFLLEGAPPEGSCSRPSASSPVATRCSPRGHTHGGRGVRARVAGAPEPAAALRAHPPRDSRSCGCSRGDRSDAEIADEIVVGAATVKTHLGPVMSKLGVRDRAQAVIFAHESGLMAS